MSLYLSTFLFIIFIFITNYCYPSQDSFDLNKYPIGMKITNEKEAKKLIDKIEKRKRQLWVEPIQSDIPNGNEGDLIRYGIQLLINTSQFIGPNAQNKKLRISSNNLNCVHCHQAGANGLPGTKKYSIPWINVINEYPQLEIKSMTIKSVEMIIRGMLGTTTQKIPDNSKEMRAIVSYINWLGKNTKANMNMEYTKLDNSIQLPHRESNPRRGKELYTTMCASCHGTEGLGSKKPNFNSGAGYQFPPIAGNDSYDDGGHMYMIPLLTTFLYTNMPLGATHEKPILKIDDAYDIAAFVNSGLKRKHNINRTLLYPIPKYRPEGFAIPENFTINKKVYDKARFGPFQSNFWW